MAENEIQILDDQPIDNATFFNFGAYAESLAGIITRKETKTPLVVGIFGDWGSGKTSLMKTLQDKIIEEKQGISAKTIWFNPWKYDKEEAIWRAIITRILEELKIGFDRVKIANIEKIDDFRTDEFIVKTENGKLNIYSGAYLWWTNLFGTNFIDAYKALWDIIPRSSENLNKIYNSSFEASNTSVSPS